MGLGCSGRGKARISSGRGGSLVRSLIPGVYEPDVLGVSTTSLYAVGRCSHHSEITPGADKCTYILKDLMPIMKYPASEALDQEPRVQALLLPALSQRVVSGTERRHEILETERHRFEFALPEHEGVCCVEDLAMPIQNQLEEAENELNAGRKYPEFPSAIVLTPSNRCVPRTAMTCDS